MTSCGEKARLVKRLQAGASRSARRMDESGVGYTEQVDGRCEYECRHAKGMVGKDSGEE